MAMKQCKSCRNIANEREFEPIADGSQCPYCLIISKDHKTWTTNDAFGDEYNRIDYSDPDLPMIRLLIGGKQHSFTVVDIPVERHRWFFEVISRKMHGIHDRAIADTTKSMQMKFKSLMGIKQ